jgi:hypothetical protein
MKGAHNDVEFRALWRVVLNPRLKVVPDPVAGEYRIVQIDEGSRGALAIRDADTDLLL